MCLRCSAPLQELFEEALDCVVDEILVYQKHFGVNLWDEEQQRLYDFSYPFVGVEVKQKYHPIDFESAARAAQYQDEFPSEPPLTTPLRLEMPEPPSLPRLREAPSYSEIPERLPQRCLLPS